MQPTTIMNGCACEVVQVKQDLLTHRECQITRRGKAADPVVQIWAWYSVINVNELVGAKTRVKSNPQQARFSLVGRVRIDLQKWRRQEAAVFHDSHPAFLLANKQSPV